MELCRRLPAFCTRLQAWRQTVRSNSNKCRASKQARTTYPRMYKTTVINADGSTYTIRYKEPRKIIEMPIDIVAMTDVERKKLWLSRQEMKDGEVREAAADEFQVDDYKHLWK